MDTGRHAPPPVMTTAPLTPLRKFPRPGEPEPWLVDYASARAAFSWEGARALLDGLPGGRGLNIAYECVGRHAAGPRRDRVAIRWLGRRGERRDLTYGRLAEDSARFANALAAIGTAPGDRVFVFLDRVPELFAAALGTLERRAVFCPLFSAFGPDPVLARARIATPRVLVTSERLYARKIAPIRAELASVEHVILVGEDGAATSVTGTHSWRALVERQSARHDIEPTDPEDPALLHFTSGTTGMPKGAVHVHGAVVMHHVTGRLALDLHPDDVFWCTADPGWVTGMSYGIVAPLTNAVTLVVDEADFDVERWYEVLERERVAVWYTAPTAIRMLMRAGAEPARGRDLSHLRFLASVGEALPPDAVLWGQEVLGRPFHDNWWQTETGGIAIANYAATEVRPGSMGRPLPGIDAGVVRRTEGGGVEEVTEPGAVGELALRPGWPSMFRGYWNDPVRTAACFAGGWYLTGDLVRCDADGWYWFVGRGDDVIKSAGHLIGPFEVESALLEHPDVAEAAVIGRPDPVCGEIVKAFVALRPGRAPGPAALNDVLAFARRRLGPAVAPREIAFVDSVPRTRSGKLMRRLLKARDLGLPEGDLSTLDRVTDDVYARPLS